MLVLPVQSHFSNEEIGRGTGPHIARNIHGKDRYVAPVWYPGLLHDRNLSHEGLRPAKFSVMATRCTLFLAIILTSIAPAQNQSKDNSADRSLVTPVPAPPATPAPNGILDKVLAMAGPADQKPQTRKQAFHTYLLSTIGPVPILGEAAGAGISQWTNSPSEWGQGWGAYGKRFGNNMAYNGVRQTITFGGGLALHEDTRYFASRSKGFWPRTKHALVSTFTARHPDGKQKFAVSSVAGVIGAASISSVWAPSSWKGIDNISQNAGVSFAFTAGFNVVREFLPDILGRPRK